MEELRIRQQLKAGIAPPLTLLGPVDDQIKAPDERLAILVRRDEMLKRLTTAQRSGRPAMSFVTTLDEATRFRRAHQVESHRGLVPQGWSSSEIRRKGRITKADNSCTSCTPCLLVEAARAVPLKIGPLQPAPPDSCDLPMGNPDF